MLFKSLIVTSLIAASANAGVIERAQPTCNADYCLRALRATQTQLSRLPVASADCTSALHTTVTPPAVTITPITDTLTITYSPTVGPFKAKRDEEFTLPSYAASCSGFSRFSSACSCIGVYTSTISLETETITATATATVSPVSFRLGAYNQDNTPRDPLWVGAQTPVPGIANLVVGAWAQSAIFTLDKATGKLYLYDNVAKGAVDNVNRNRVRMYGPTDTVPEGYDYNYNCWVGGFTGYNLLECKLPGTTINTWGFISGEPTALFIGKPGNLPTQIKLRMYYV